MARFRLLADLDRGIPKAERLAAMPPPVVVDSEAELLAALSRDIHDPRVEVGRWERLPEDEAAA